MEFNEYPASMLAAALGLLMFFGDLIGDRMRKNSFKLKGEKSIGLGPLEGSLLGLLSLLLSFTFQMAAQRYDQRRSVLIDETNRIGTAVLRSDLLQKKDREEVRGLFRNYVKTRIAYYEAAANLMTNAALDPFGKIPEFKYCAIAVKAGGKLAESHGFF